VVKSLDDYGLRKRDIAVIDWQDSKCFKVNNVAFRLVGFGEGKRRSTLDEFIVLKHDWMIRRYAKLIEQLQPKNIFELGIQRGGSCVLFQQMAQAEKLVAIEINPERVPAVDEYIEKENLQNVLKPFYGVDQSDMYLLRKIVAEEFGAGYLDLVIDDASHFLDETRNSFNALFPSVRPGGAYIIEDWSWAHAKIDQPDDTPNLFPEREPLTRLVFEIVMACPSSYELIEEIVIDKNSATIWRGEGAIDSGSFDISKCMLARGRALIS
jgi:hypothetical protein